MNDLPLVGIRVLELGHIVAGPAAGLVLADLGAEVIKVEDPTRGGDNARNAPAGTRSTFYFLNRNKKSCTLNLSAAEGRDIFLELVKRSDVVLDNYAPGVLRKLGVDYEEAAKINPRIIYCSIHGFLEGPYAHRPALDGVVQMMGGIAYMTGPPGTPLRIGASVTDLTAAAYGAIGILVALWQRERTGRGQRITSGLFETVVLWVGQHMANFAVTGEPVVPHPVRQMGERFRWGIFDNFTAADGKLVFIGVTSNKHWEAFCSEFEQPELLANPDLDDNEKRTQARPWLLPKVQEIVGRYGSGDLMEKAERCRIPYAPINTPADLYDDPHLSASDQRLLPVVAGDKTIRLPALPFESSMFRYSVRIHPPRLGEHTPEVLRELGYDDARVRELSERGVI